MRAVIPSDYPEFGDQLSDSILIPEQTLNTLFAALLLTSATVFLSANVLFFDLSVLQETAPIALTCFCLLLIFYGLSTFLNNLGWGLVLTYSLMWLVTYCRCQWIVPMVYAFGVIGLAYAIRFLRIGNKELLPVFLMALIATAVILGCNGTYTSFDMLQRLHAGEVHKDTLFHASIAGMIKNYGVSSTGLNGLIEIPYHTFSHVLMASISILAGAGVLEVYGVASWVFFSPLLIFCIVAFCAMLDLDDDRTKAPLAWLFVCVLLVLAPSLFGRWALGNAFFGSESYLVSLGLFQFGLALLFKRNLNSTDLILAAIISGFIGYAKGSVGLIYAGLWLLRVLFLRGGIFWLDLIGFFLVAIAVGLMTFSSAAANGPANIAPLSFISNYSFLGGYVAEVGKSLLGGANVSWRSALLVIAAIGSFSVFHFFFSWIVVARFLYKKGFKLLQQSPMMVYSIGAVAAGVLIILLFDIPGGSVGYFSGVALFVSLPGVVALLLRSYNEALSKSNYKTKTMIPLTFCFSLLFIFGMEARVVIHKVLAHKQYAKQHSTFVDSLLALRHQAPFGVVMRLQPSPESISKNPISECTAQPFVYPAVSERPWVDVIMPLEDCVYLYYGYPQYGITPLHQYVSVQPKLLPAMTERVWPALVRE